MQVAGDFLEVYGAGRAVALADYNTQIPYTGRPNYDQAASWDCVATCYFLDTANNILEYVRCISSILKVGGHWINFGPLLYHFAGMPNEVSIEISYAELKAIMEPLGLRMVVRPSSFMRVICSSYGLVV